VNLYVYCNNNSINLVDPDGFLGERISDWIYQTIGLNFGFISSASGEWGIGVIGVGVTDSAGRGYFSGSGQGAFSSTGAFAGGPGYGPSYPSGNSGNFSYGAYLGAGSGFYTTNASSVSQLSGPFDTWSVNFPLVAFQYGTSNGVGIFSITGGPGAVFNVSHYKTTTRYNRMLWFEVKSG
jgi:hypothetical protein